MHLMSVNNYDFPALQGYDRYISEKWFVRDGLNLEAEALAQLSAALSTGEYDWYAEGTGHAGGARRLRARAPAPVLRGTHARQTRTGGDVEHRPPGRCATLTGDAGADGMVGS